jgi:hypothetical protein
MNLFTETCLYIVLFWAAAVLVSMFALSLKRPPKPPSPPYSDKDPRTESERREDDEAFSETYHWKEDGLSRRKVDDPVIPGNTLFVYTCRCGVELTDGPEGGCAVNMVCRACGINYGCLPKTHY